MKKLLTTTFAIPHPEAGFRRKKDVHEVRPMNYPVYLLSLSGKRVTHGGKHHNDRRDHTDIKRLGSGSCRCEKYGVNKIRHIGGFPFSKVCSVGQPPTIIPHSPAKSKPPEGNFSRILSSSAYRPMYAPHAVFPSASVTSTRTNVSFVILKLACVIP